MLYTDSCTICSTPYRRGGIMTGVDIALVVLAGLVVWFIIDLTGGI
jgi:hypothetical protein